MSCPSACTIDARLLVPVTAYVPCRMNATGKSTLGSRPSDLGDEERYGQDGADQYHVPGHVEGLFEEAGTA